MSKPQKAPDYLLAKAVENAVFSSLLLSMNATTEQDQQKWERHADKLEAKYTSERGEHYATTIARGPQSET